MQFMEGGDFLNGRKFSDVLFNTLLRLTRVFHTLGTFSTNVRLVNFCIKVGYNFKIFEIFK